MSSVAPYLSDPPTTGERASFDLVRHGHQDLVQAVVFNEYGDRCATGSVDGKIRVFNRHKDGIWRNCDCWTAHGGEIVEMQWLPPTIHPSLLASLGIEGSFKIWAEDPGGAPGRRFAIPKPRKWFLDPEPKLKPGSVSSTTAAGAGAGVGINVNPDASPSLHGAPHPSANPHLGSHPNPNPQHSSSAHPNPSPGPSPGPSPNPNMHPNASPGAASHPNSISNLAANPAHASSLGGAGAGGHASNTTNARAVFETRKGRSPYRSFSMKYLDDVDHTYLALLSADGVLTVYENSSSWNLGGYVQMDELVVCPRPARGEETAFRVRFDPNAQPCYNALRAGVPLDSVGLVVAAMDTVKIYRTRDVVTTSMGVPTTVMQFYLAAEVGVHKGLVRDLAWAPGNIRGYDIIATACQDGFARVFKITTPGGHEGGEADEKAEKRQAGWSVTEVKEHVAERRGYGEETEKSRTARKGAVSAISAGIDQLKTTEERRVGTGPGQIKHVVTEVSKLDDHQTPVWRVGFDDDGQILGSVGDEGKLLCYRQTPDGSWAVSSELSMIKMKMAAP